jgi:hypothetical protein
MVSTGSDIAVSDRSHVADATLPAPARAIPEKSERPMVPLSERSAAPETNIVNRQNGSSPKPAVLQRDPASERALIDEAPGENASIESTLLWLIRLSKEGTDSVWEEQFDGILNVVLELMGDPEPRNRDLALRALRELLRNQTRFFGSKQEMVIERLLEQFRVGKDAERDVMRSAEEALTVLAAVVDMDCWLSMYERTEILDMGQGSESERTKNRVVAVLKLMTKVIPRMDVAKALACLHQILPGLLKGYKSVNADVRKAVVFALVELHLILGDSLKSHLTSLTSVQSKLFHMYIKKREELMKGESSEV